MLFVHAGMGNTPLLEYSIVHNNNNNNNNNIYLKSNIHSITRYKFSRLYKNMVTTIWLYNAY